MLAAGITAWVVASLMPGGVHWGGLVAGWLVGLANAGTARFLNRRAVGTGSWAFIRWGIAGNILRMVALLAILLAVVFTKYDGKGSFIAAVFIGFFIFLLAEIADLNQRDGRNRETS